MYGFEITVVTRPCKVRGMNALFHRWNERSEIIQPSCLRGGHGGGLVKDVFALVEMEDGTMREFSPSEIRFLDSRGRFEQYCFDEEVNHNAEHSVQGNQLPTGKP